MYINNSTTYVKVGTPVPVLFNIPNTLGIKFNSYLCNKATVDIQQITLEISDYIKYSDTILKVSEASLIDTTLIHVVDASTVPIDSIIRIDNSIYKVTETDIVNMTVTVNKKLHREVAKDEEIKIIKYPQVIGMYYGLLTINTVGTYKLIIKSVDGNHTIDDDIDVVDNLPDISDVSSTVCSNIPSNISNNVVG